MADIDHRQPERGLQPFEIRQDLAFGCSVQRRKRLIHQQQPGLRQQSPPDRHALPLPAGEMAWPPAQQRIEPQQSDDLVKPDHPRCDRWRRAKKQVAPHAEMGKQARLLEHIAHRAAMRGAKQRLPLPVFLANPAQAIGGPMKPRDTPQHGRLATARRSHQRRDPLRRHAKGRIEPKIAQPVSKCDGDLAQHRRSVMPGDAPGRSVAQSDASPE